MPPIDNSQANDAPIEDAPYDVIKKAMRGHALTAKQLAVQSGITTELIEFLLIETPIDKEPTEAQQQALCAVARVLGLNTQALLLLPTYRPKVQFPAEFALQQIVTEFGDAGVNAYIIHNGSDAYVFDTGTRSAPIFSYLNQHKLSLRALYITHAHRDHIAGLEDFPPELITFPEDLEHRGCHALGKGLQLTALDTSGHCTPSRAYLIEKEESDSAGPRPPSICLCGDILFAGSMGKTASPEHYLQSIHNASHHLLSLPFDTLLCPGHGPITSVGQELKHNVFLALPR